MDVTSSRFDLSLCTEGPVHLLPLIKVANNDTCWGYYSLDITFNLLGEHEKFDSWLEDELSPEKKKAKTKRK